MLPVSTLFSSHVDRSNTAKSMLYRTVCLLSEFVHSICPPPISPPPTWLPACLVRISESTGALACWLQTLGLLSLGACNRPGLFCETNPTQQGKLSPGPCLAPFGGGVEDLRHTPRALLCAPFERERRAEKVMVGSFLGWLAWALNWWTYDTGMRPPNSSNKLQVCMDFPGSGIKTVVGLCWF